MEIKCMLLLSWLWCFLCITEHSCHESSWQSRFCLNYTQGTVHGADTNESWALPVRGLQPAEALACCTAMASVARGFWAAALMGTLITGLSLTFNTVPPTVPVTVSSNKTRLWGNTLRHNVINLVGKQSCLPYRNGCQHDSRLHTIHAGVTKADSSHIRARSLAPADIYSTSVTSVSSRLTLLNVHSAI